MSGEPNETHPVIEVFIGGWKNSKSVIRLNQNKPEVAETDTPNILSPNEFRGFWIRATDGVSCCFVSVNSLLFIHFFFSFSKYFILKLQVITVGRENEAAAFLSWHNPHPFMINYVGVATGWGAAGSWIIDDPQPNYGWQGSQQAQNIATEVRSDFGSGGSPCWVPASNGEVPPEAVEGGIDGMLKKFEALILLYIKTNFILRFQ